MVRVLQKDVEQTIQLASCITHRSAGEPNASERYPQRRNTALGPLAALPTPISDVLVPLLAAKGRDDSDSDQDYGCALLIAGLAEGL